VNVRSEAESVSLLRPSVRRETGTVGPALGRPGQEVARRVLDAFGGQGPLGPPRWPGERTSSSLQDAEVRRERFHVTVRIRVAKRPGGPHDIGSAADEDHVSLAKIPSGRRSSRFVGSHLETIAIS
jgi:hypothetical protein